MPKKLSPGKAYCITIVAFEGKYEIYEKRVKYYDEYFPNIPIKHLKQYEDIFFVIEHLKIDNKFFLEAYKILCEDKIGFIHEIEATDVQEIV